MSVILLNSKNSCLSRAGIAFLAVLIVIVLFYTWKNCHYSGKWGLQVQDRQNMKRIFFTLKSQDPNNRKQKGQLKKLVLHITWISLTLQPHMYSKQRIIIFDEENLSTTCFFHCLILIAFVFNGIDTNN